MLIYAVIVIALFFTWFSSKRRDILVSMITGLLWFALGMWIFFSTTPPLGLDESWKQILAWVFFILTFVPFLTYMNAESKHEAKSSLGQSITWNEWGSDIQDQIKQKPDSQLEYRRELRKRLRR